jgi:pantoate--beta-alanine ligase
MGALHQGHLSLLARAKETCSTVVVSIFVNPTQFNEISDFENYPSTLTTDISLLTKAGCDILFTPSVKEMYPEGPEKKNQYNLGYLEDILEGKYRPGHFQGVCQVVDRLLNIVDPDLLFLGEKDFQQCKVIEKLLSITGRESKTKLIISPTIRETDGLAMSSRNQRLSESQRIKSAMIYKCLQQISEDIKLSTLISAKKNAVKFLTDEGFDVDYVDILDNNTLEYLSYPMESGTMRVLVAAKLGEIRLIDNIML